MDTDTKFTLGMVWIYSVLGAFFFGNIVGDMQRENKMKIERNIAMEKIAKCEKVFGVRK